MPDIVTLKAAKFWIALFGAVVTSIIATVPDAPAWLAATSAVLTAVGVYLTPNQTLTIDDVPTDSNITEASNG